MKKILLFLLAILPFAVQAQKGKKFEFDYFALELSFNSSFSGTPDTCFYKYISNNGENFPIFPVKTISCTPGFTAGLLFNHDLHNNKLGFVVGVNFSSRGQTAKYQTADRKTKLTETQRVMTLGIPFYVKFGHEIYKDQFYFLVGTEVDLNLNFITSQKMSNEKGRTRSTDDQEAIKLLTFPIYVGFNYTTLNFRLGVQPMGLFDKNYEIKVGTEGNYQTINPFAHNSSVIVYANIGFVIPLSQWTVKRSYFLSRIF